MGKQCKYMGKSIHAERTLKVKRKVGHAQAILAAVQSAKGRVGGDESEMSPLHAKIYRTLVRIYYFA